MTEDLITRIKRHEGLRLHAYLDSTSHGTIGYGHKLLPGDLDKYRGGITEEQAENLLYADVAVRRHQVDKLLPWITALSVFRQEILVEMAYQLGANGLLGFHNMLFCLRSGDFAGARDAMLDSAWHEETPTRCEELAALMEAGA